MQDLEDGPEQIWREIGRKIKFWMDDTVVPGSRLLFIRPGRYSNSDPGTVACGPHSKDLDG